MRPDLVPVSREIQEPVGPWVPRVPSVDDVRELARIGSESDLEDGTELVAAPRLDRRAPARSRVLRSAPAVKAPDIVEVSRGVVTVVAV